MTSPQETSIGKRIARGGLTLILLRVFMRMLSLISTMILFRILVPDDFGLVSLAMTAVGLVDVMIEFGFDTALIQKRNASDADYNTTWTLSLLRGLACSLLLALMAAPAASFLHDPRLETMIYWLAVAPTLDGLRNVGVVQFSKELQFHKEFTYKLSQKLLGFFLTLFLAWWLRSYWALVIGILATKVAGLVLSYTLHSFRPRLSLQGWRDVIRFSIWIVFNNIALYAGNQTDKVVLQKYFDAHVVGIYRIAEEMCSVVLELIWPVEQALYAGYSKISGNLQELHRILLNSLGLVALISIPVSLGIMLVADPLLALLLGPNAAGAGAFMKVLVLHGAIRSCLAGVLPAFMALGMPKANTRSTIVMVLVRLGVLFGTFPLIGAMAAPWSLVAGSATGFLMVWFQACKMMQFRLLDFPRVLWRSIGAATVMALSVPWLETLIFGAAWLPAPWIQLGFRILTGMLIYALTVLTLWTLSGRPPGAETALLTLVRQRILAARA